jgi:hypothetical protein
MYSDKDYLMQLFPDIQDIAASDKGCISAVIYLYMAYNCKND